MSQKPAEPTTVITPRTRAQRAGRLLLESSVFGKGRICYATAVPGFQEERKEKDGRK